MKRLKEKHGVSHGCADEQVIAWLKQAYDQA
jgi:hypothetical protein